MRKIFLDDLPKWGKSGHGIEGSINWLKCTGCNVKFIYDDIEGQLNILGYDINKKTLIISYNNIKTSITYVNFIKCKIGKIIGKRNSEHQISIGQVLKDNKRDITITYREYRYRKYKTKDNKIVDKKEKWYKYTCNVCKWKEGWMIESELLRGTGCSCCNSKTVVEGINDIPTTNPEMVKYFQGGYDEAKLYTCGSGHNIYPICPDCGRIKDKSMKINTIYKNHSIGCSCSDNISFGEKTVYSVLTQIGLNFEFHKTFEWSKNIQTDNLKLCGNKEYDFYFELNEERYIVEAHGLQHYEKGFERIKSNKKVRTLEEEQENDRIKKELALANGIKEKNYIIIDCRKSELDWIKDNKIGIFNSRLNELSDLTKVNWNEVANFVSNNLVKEVCSIKNNNPNMTTTDIGNIFKLSVDTIRVYLKQGNDIWCNYDAKEELKTSASKNGIKSRKEVEVFKNEKSLGIFESLHYLEDNSLRLFGTNFTKGNMSRVCNGKQSEHKGFTFKYVEYEIACY